MMEAVSNLVAATATIVHLKFLIMQYLKVPSHLILPRYKYFPVYCFHTTGLQYNICSRVRARVCVMLNCGSKQFFYKGSGVAKYGNCM